MENITALPLTLPGTLWGVCAYFNPAGYHSRLKNFQMFRDRMRKQGLPFIVAEAALGDAPFSLSDADADIVIHVRTSSMIWQKERLLNLARRALPADCDKVVCLDTDIIFLRQDWIPALSKALERHVVVQPFETILHSVPGSVPEEGRTTLEGMEGVRGLSAARSYTDFPQILSGHPGFAVGVRRSLLDECELCDWMIVGGGDSLFMGACYGLCFEQNNFIRSQNTAMHTASEPWCKKVFELVQGSVDYIDGDIVHLWHGDRNQRFYHHRKSLLDDFDPRRDICTTKDGCLEWNHASEALKKNVATYFLVRDEDQTGSMNTNSHAREMYAKFTETVL